MTGTDHAAEPTSAVAPPTDTATTQSRRGARPGYLRMTDVARLLDVSHSLVRSWVHGHRSLPEPFPTPDAVSVRANGAQVAWWRTTRSEELVQWRLRHLAYLADQVRHQRRRTRGPQGRRQHATPDALTEIARSFFGTDPVPALQALALIRDHGERGLDHRQRAVAERAYELVCLIDEFEQRGHSASEQLAELVRDIEPRRARAINRRGVLNQLAYLLPRIGQAKLSDCLAQIDKAEDEHHNGNDIDAANTTSSYQTDERAQTYADPDSV